MSKRSCEHPLERAATQVPVASRSHDHVRGERREAGRDRPDVQVVDLDHVALRRHRAARPAPTSMPGRRRLHQHVDRLLQQPPRAGRDQRRDQEARRSGRPRSSPSPARPRRATTTPSELSASRGRVPQHPLEVDVLALAGGEHPGRGHVAGQADEAEHQHPAAADVRRVREPRDRLDHDQHRRSTSSSDAVDERAEDLAALKAEGARRRRRHAGEPRRHEPDRDRADVGERGARRRPAAPASRSGSRRRRSPTSSATLIASATDMRAPVAPRGGRRARACDGARGHRH